MAVSVSCRGKMLWPPRDTSDRVSDGLVGVVTLTNTVWSLVIELFKKILVLFTLQDHNLVLLIQVSDDLHNIAAMSFPRLLCKLL